MALQMARISACCATKAKVLTAIQVFWDAVSVHRANTVMLQAYLCVNHVKQVFSNLLTLQFTPPVLRAQLDSFPNLALSPAPIVKLALSAITVERLPVTFVRKVVVQTTRLLRFNAAFAMQ